MNKAQRDRLIKLKSFRKSPYILYKWGQGHWGLYHISKWKDYFTSVGKIIGGSMRWKDLEKDQILTWCRDDKHPLHLYTTLEECIKENFDYFLQYPSMYNIYDP